MNLTGNDADRAMALTVRPRPHDLVRLVPDAVSLAGAPAWVRASLARAPWADVRTAGRRHSLRTPESLRHVDDWAAIPDVAAMRASRPDPEPEPGRGRLGPSLVRTCAGPWLYVDPWAEAPSG